MPFCQSCGTSVNSDARFCNACGQPANIPLTPAAAVAVAGGAVALPIEVQAAAPNIALPQTSIAAVAGVRSGDGARRAHRPRGVTILAVLAFLGMIPSIILAVVLAGYAASANAEASIPLAQLLMRLFPYLAQGQRDMVSQASAAAIAMFVFAIFFAVMSYGLWTLRRWGRIVAIAGGGLTALRAAALIFVSPGSLLWQLIVIGINIWIITYLLKPHVKQAFGVRAS